MSAEQPPTGMIACSLIATLAVFALGTGPQVDAGDSDVPTAIERALIERACSVNETSPLADAGAHQQCLSARLLSLRTDFGRDLSRLSSADRKSIDAACGSLRTYERREPYLDCLGEQLAAVRLRQNHGNRPRSEDVAVAPVPHSAPAVAAAPQAHKVSPWLSTTVIAGILGFAIVAIGVALFALRSRHAPSRCRNCGATVSHSDLCAACRHEAAEALRRAANERARSPQVQGEQERPQRDDGAEQRERAVRDAEEARRREHELAIQREEAVRERPAEEVHEDHAAVAPIAAAAEEGESVFDPYAVLGVPPDASQEEIGAAYQQARTKYDTDLVSHLGDETQAYFKAKAEAIERAYQALIDVHP